MVKLPLLQRRDKNQTLQPLSPLHLHRKATKKQLQLKSNQPPQNPQKQPLQQKKGGGNTNNDVASPTADKANKKGAQKKPPTPANDNESVSTSSTYSSSKIVRKRKKRDPAEPRKELQRGTMKKKNNIVNPVQLQELQQQMVRLQQENDELQKDQLKLAKQAAEKKTTKKPTKSSTKPQLHSTTNNDDVTSEEDEAVDYTIEKNYSVKRFIGHNIKLNDGKGPPNITLKATWKGYPINDPPTMEPWGKMKKYHKRQLVRYVNKHEELKKMVETYQLFNSLKK